MAVTIMDPRFMALPGPQRNVTGETADQSGRRLHEQGAIDIGTAADSGEVNAPIAQHCHRAIPPGVQHLPVVAQHREPKAEKRSSTGAISARIGQQQMAIGQGAGKAAAAPQAVRSSVAMSSRTVESDADDMIIRAFRSTARPEPRPVCGRRENIVVI